MPCERCGKQNPADVHTCTPCREYMLDIIQKEINQNIEFTTLNTIIIEKSTGRKHIIRGFDIKGIVTLNLHTMRNMHLLWEEYYIPVTISDVLDYIEKIGNIECSKYDGEGACDCYNDMVVKTSYKIIDLRQYKRKPLSDQSYECIRYIYSLLPPEVRK